jgi:hypothetical protein
MHSHRDRQHGEMRRQQQSPAPFDGAAKEDEREVEEGDSARAGSEGCRNHEEHGTDPGERPALAPLPHRVPSHPGGAEQQRQQGLALRPRAGPQGRGVTDDHRGRDGTRNRSAAAVADRPAKGGERDEAEHGGQAEGDLRGQARLLAGRH